MFRAPGSAGLPSFDLMLQDLPATPAQVARHLDITSRTMQRYQAGADVPRAVMLALFWETRWGRSVADTEAANWGALHFRRAEIADREARRLRGQIEVLERELCAMPGAANGPLYQVG